jgi:hypothetical protein
MEHWKYNQKEDFDFVLTENRASLQYDVKINNHADIMFQINRKSDFEDRDFSPPKTVYFFIANFKMNKNIQDDDWEGEIKVGFK